MKKPVKDFVTFLLAVIVGFGLIALANSPAEPKQPNAPAYDYSHR